MTMPRFVIRKVDVNDPAVWARIATMDAQCFSKVDAPALSSNAGTWWIARAGEQDAGYCCVKPATSTPDAGYLARAGVVPKFRGCGLQKVLIRRRITFAKTQGWKRLVTDTCNNPASANSLIACGFRMFDPTAKWAFDHGCYWQLFLVKGKK